jgi:hypothetical protein
MELTINTSWAELEYKIGVKFNNSIENQNTRRLVAIIVGSDGSKLMQDTIVNRINELHYRSGDAIDFYVIGWKWKSSTPSHNISNSGPDARKTTVDVEFYPDKFSQCIDSLHQRLNWRYSGEVDLILMDAVIDDQGVMLDDRYAISINLKSRMTDGTILSVNGLIESIIDFAKSSDDKYPVQKYATQRLIGVALAGVVDLITGLSPKGIQRLVRNAIYMMPRDQASKEGRVMRLARHSEKKGLGV